MAGESPDKVERVESSGETTAEGGTVASTSGPKSGGKAERKAGARSGADRSGTSEEAAGAHSEAADGASDGQSGDASGAYGESEAEAAESPREEADSEPDEAGADSGTTGAGEEAGEAADTTDAGSAAEAEGRSDDRLKAAVAAWVAGSEGDAGGEGADGDSVKGEADESSDRETKSSQIPSGERPLGEKAGDGEKPSSAEDSAGGSEAPAASDAPDAAEGTRATDGAADAAVESDQPTAMFRTVRPGWEDSAAATDGEEAARRAERMTAAFFGAGKSTGSGGAAKAAGSAGTAAGEGEADEAGDSASGADSAGRQDRPEVDGRDGPAEDAAKGSSGKGGEDSAGHGTEATGGSREESSAERRGESEAEPEADAREDRGESADAGGQDADDGGEEPGGLRDEQAGEDAGDRLDDATRAIRTLRPGGAADGPEAPAGKKDESSGLEQSTARIDQPTTAFRAVAPGKEDSEPGGTETGGVRSAGGSKAEADEKGTAEEGTAKPETAGAKKSGADAKAAKPRDPRVAGYAGDAPEKGSEKGSETGAESDAERADKAPAKGSGKGSKKAAPSEQAPESDAERTSKFVPLRSADVPPKPRTPAPAVPPEPEGGPQAGELPPEAEPRPLSEAELTRQQVRPDQAPLDLLAQLTNTPPPPETPLRVAVRRVKIWTPLVVLLAVLFAVAQAVRPLPEPELTLSAQPTYSFQGPKPSVPWPSEGQAALDVQGLGSLGTYGKQKPVPIASVAKVMTAYVILRDHPVKKGSEGAEIPVDKKAEDEAGLSAQNESTVEVKKGDTLTEREAVQAVMIASANNVARLLARWDAGSEKAFAKKMNKVAAGLGMKNTRYTDPSGLTSSTVSTATDQVKLAKKAMEIDLFREIVRQPGYTDGKGEQHSNWNKLVPLDGVVGIKTGTTTKAGGNLLFAAEQRVGGTKQLIIGAVLGQYRPSILDTVLAESKKLIDTAQDSLRSQQVVQKGEVVGYVDDQLGGKTPVVASRDVSAVGWSGLRVKLGLTDGGKTLPHEGKAGDRAGTLTVGDGPGQVRVPVKLKEDMTAPGFGAKLTRIL